MDAPSVRSFNPNKHLKEQFVSNLTGSSMLELFVLCNMLPALLLIRRSIGFTADCTNIDKSLKKNDNLISGSRKWRTYTMAVVLDYLNIMVPIVVFPTVLAKWTYINGIFFMLLLLFSIVARRYCSSSKHDDGARSLRENISSYRVSMMLITCLCILAVDFKIFPRRYAKTETYGTSLMDLGVGSFVLGNSLVSRKARGISAMKLRSVLLSTSPLLFLGFARLVFTTGVDYQVHVGEYGVHWNFFFTLAAVAILTSVIRIPPSYCGILGLFILTVHQISLLQGLNVYLLSNERGTDIVSQNKEGIFSIFGYWGIYLIGVHLGNYLLFGNSNVVLRAKKWARTRVWILCVLFWFLTWFLDRHVERVSRRLCNVAYVAFVFASNLQILSLVMLSDFIPGQNISVLEEAFNRNLLGTFILANILTGLVNLSIDTIFVSSASGLAILLSYIFILSVAVAVADLYGIRLKFW